MPDLEQASGKFTEISLKKNSGAGAGANASSRVNMVFITTNPLSELVWSPQKGLSLKYANSSLSEKKASLLWNAESFNIMTLPPQCPNVGETSNAQDNVERNLELTQLNVHSESKNSNRATLPSPPQSALGTQPISLTLIHEQYSRSYGDMRQFKSTSRDLDTQKDEKEGALHSKSNSRGDEVLKGVSEAVDGIPEASNLVADNQKSLKDLKRYSAQVGCEHIPNVTRDIRELVGTRKDHLLGMEGRAEHYSLEKHDFVTKLPSSPKIIATEGLASENVRSSTRVIECADNFPSLSKQGTLGREAIELHRNEVCHTLSAQASDEHEVQLRKVSLLGISAPTEVLLNKNDNPQNHVEGNQHINSHAVGRVSTSKETVDSHESVESNNSKEVSSTRKRELTLDLELSLENKRLKRPAHEKVLSGSFNKQDSSFMNWISTMTNGFSRSNQAKPLRIVSHSSVERKVETGSLPLSHGKNEGSCTNIGFGSIFQALHCPRFINEKAHKALDCLREADLLSERDDREQVDGDPCLVCSDGMDSNLRNAIATTSKVANSDLEGKVSGGYFVDKSQLQLSHKDVKLQTGALHSCENLNEGTCVVEAVPLKTMNISADNSLTHENTKDNNDKYCSYGNNQSPTTTFEGKAIGMIPSVLNGYPNLITKNRSAFHESLWISRLLPKVGVSNPESGNCSQDIRLSNERNTKITAKCCPSSLGQKTSALGLIKTIGPSHSDGSNGTDTDRNSKSKLDRVLTSQRLIKSEPMASVFAKRLDAFKHITPKEPFKNTKSVVKTCFFCGNVGHGLKECSELTESELEDLLRDLNSYDSTDGLLSICIHCFAFNHWAISCPYLSSSQGKNIREHNSFIFGSENCDNIENVEHYSFANNDRRVVLWRGGKGQHHLVDGHAFPDKENVNSDREKNKLAVHWSKSSLEKDLCSNTNKENLEESTSKANQNTSMNMNNVSKVDHSIPICNMFATDAADDSSGTFQTIRQLQLSRIDVIRLMNSLDSKIDLEGFFLRLRVGKWAENYGFSGYRVARINGASSKYCICVNIGGSECSVDCRFISNHEFTEDELKLWWAAVVKSSSKPPTNEELNEKLMQRMKFGL
ncbi:hypothetical protein J5N97_009862 [Dioscorea zingiberensis]|uniref:CCHC-type domain-containing protein n=1 Tax=Dioscorea zingiberensis TaxID=325984 RepID=A0A9D5CZ40_9LILI|nr:hypothetical protein J5N97_009862 [Dioscorea zingiberensis]